MFDPTAMILSSAAQQRHLSGARLDGPVEPTVRQRPHRIRRSTAALLVRAATAIEPTPRAARPARSAAQLHSAQA